MGRKRKRNSNRNQKQGLGIFVNRRKPGSGWVTVGDVMKNIAERFYCWTRRVPEGSVLIWNSHGKIIGHRSKAKKPW